MKQTVKSNFGKKKRHFYKVISYFNNLIFLSLSDKPDNLNEKSSETKERPSLSAKEPKSTICCLGVLPGLGAYTDSSDSENSSESDVAENEYDLVGRSRIHVQNVNERQ